MPSFVEPGAPELHADLPLNCFECPTKVCQESQVPCTVTISNMPSRAASNATIFPGCISFADAAQALRCRGVCVCVCLPLDTATPQFQICSPSTPWHVPSSLSHGTRYVKSEGHKRQHESSPWSWGCHAVELEGVRVRSEKLQCQCQVRGGSGGTGGSALRGSMLLGLLASAKRGNQ